MGPRQGARRHRGAPRKRLLRGRSFAFNPPLSFQNNSAETTPPKVAENGAYPFEIALPADSIVAAWTGYSAIARFAANTTFGTMAQVAATISAVANSETKVR